MPHVDLSVRASRAPLNAPLEEEDDFETRLVVAGETFDTSVARFYIAGVLAAEAPQPVFHTFCSRAIGAPAHAWPELAADAGLALLVDPTGAGTIEQNAMKAVYIIVQWLEPQLVAEHGIPDLERELRDELIVDYTGAPGTQRYVYFVARDPPEGAAARLHRLHLLCTLTLRVEAQQIRRYFVPLVVPGVGVHHFDVGSPQGGPIYRMWQGIRSDSGRRVARLLRR